MEHQPVGEHLEIPWTQIIGFTLSVAFASWAWVVKTFGQQHIDSVKELAVELRELRKDVNNLMARVQVVEFAQAHLQKDD